MGSLASISCARGLNLAGRHDLSSIDPITTMSTSVLDESHLSGRSFISHLLSAAKKELEAVALGRRCAKSLG